MEDSDLTSQSHDCRKDNRGTYDSSFHHQLGGENVISNQNEGMTAAGEECADFVVGTGTVTRVMILRRTKLHDVDKDILLCNYLDNE